MHGNELRQLHGLNTVELKVWFPIFLYFDSEELELSFRMYHSLTFCHHGCYTLIIPALFQLGILIYNVVSATTEDTHSVHSTDPVIGYYRCEPLRSNPASCNYMSDGVVIDSISNAQTWCYELRQGNATYRWVAFHATALALLVMVLALAFSGWLERLIPLRGTNNGVQVLLCLIWSTIVTFFLAIPATIYGGTNINMHSELADAIGQEAVLYAMAMTTSSSLRVPFAVLTLTCYTVARVSILVYSVTSQESESIDTQTYAIIEWCFLLTLSTLAAWNFDYQMRVAYLQHMKIVQANVNLKDEVDPFHVESIRTWLNQTPSEDGTVADVAQRFKELEVDGSRLEIIEKVGSGAAGEVYKANYLGVEVAVKKTAQEFISHPSDLKEFCKEVSVLAHLSHPLIVGFYGICRTPDGGDVGIAIVNEFCVTDLDQLIHDDPLWCVAEAPRILLQIADAMAYLHRNRILHLDLKPANVLLDDRGFCKLTDFGLSYRTLRRDTRAAATTGGPSGDLSTASRTASLNSYDRATALGTPGFIAPEKWCIGQQADVSNFEAAAKLDSFAFGVTMSCVYTSHDPYAGKNPSRRNNSEQLINALPSTCPDRIAEIVKLCVAFDPASRPTFTEASDMLLQYRNVTPCNIRAQKYHAHSQISPTRVVSC